MENSTDEDFLKQRIRALFAQLPVKHQRWVVEKLKPLDNHDKERYLSGALRVCHTRK